MSRRDLARHAADLSARLGVTVHASATLEEALTHPSASSSARPDNQRLEFLGDRVLGLVIAEAVYEAFPDSPEGLPRAHQGAAEHVPALPELRVPDPRVLLV